MCVGGGGVEERHERSKGGREGGRSNKNGTEGEKERQRNAGGGGGGGGGGKKEVERHGERARISGADPREEKERLKYGVSEEANVMAILEVPYCSFLCFFTIS